MNSLSTRSKPKSNIVLNPGAQRKQHVSPHPRQHHLHVRTRATGHCTPYTAVKDTMLTIAPGEFVSVVGPTGCGKSTLLNIAPGLLAPSSGRVTVFDTPLAGASNRQAGYMF